jgi:PST family polysaccharide transporter
LFSNLVSLSVLQAANYILPLLTLPYLIRVLGAEKFGLLSFATAITAYFATLTDYGFNLSATREVSINRNQPDALARIFSSVMTIKAGLLLVSLLLMTLIVFATEKFSSHWPIFFLTFGTVIGQMLLPVWFFQGMEEMKYVTYLNIGAKFVFTVLVFWLVNASSDYLIVPALTSAGGIVSGAWSLYIIRKRFGVRFRWQPWGSLLAELKSGWHIFAATSFGTLYRESNTVILGFLCSPVVVGYYAIAEKIVKAIQSVQTPLGQAFFPYFSRKTPKEVLHDYVLRHQKLVIAAYGLLWAGILIGSEIIIRRLSGASDQHVLSDFRILSTIIFIGGLNYYFGVLGLLTIGKSKLFSRAVGVAGLFNLSACMLLAYFYEDTGAAVSVVLSEVVLLMIVVRHLRAESRAELAL